MKISVVIPLYNKRDTVLRALKSVFNQTSQPEEIIVINDGSTDGSEKIVTDLNHPLVKLICQSNSGVSAARNRGISEAKCDWIAFLDADDEWLPEYLETIIFLLQRYPECSVAATAYLLQDPKGKRHNLILNKVPFENDHGILSNYFEVSSCSHPPLCSSVVAVKKSALESINGFPEGIRSGEDLLTWARLAAKFDIAYSIKAMSIFIQNENSLIRIPEIPDMVSKGFQTLFQASHNKHIKNYISFWHKMRARNYIMIGQKKKAMEEIFRSIKYKFNSKAWIFIPFLLLDIKFFISVSEKYKRYFNK